MMKMKPNLPCPQILRDKILGCCSCPLNKQPYDPGLPTQTIGSRYPKIAFFAEAPGQLEAQEGIPLIGSAGATIFQPALEILNLDLKDITVGNVVKHRPPKNRNPTDKEILACSDILLEELDYLQPQNIVALGKIPTRAFYLIMKKESPKKSLHGTHFDFVRPDGRKYKVYVTHHPAYVVYNGGLKSKIGEEFLKEIQCILQKI